MPKCPWMCWWIYWSMLIWRTLSLNRQDVKNFFPKRCNFCPRLLRNRCLGTTGGETRLQRFRVLSRAKMPSELDFRISSFVKAYYQWRGQSCSACSESKSCNSLRSKAIMELSYLMLVAGVEAFTQFTWNSHGSHGSHVATLCLLCVFSCTLPCCFQFLSPCIFKLPPQVNAEIEWWDQWMNENEIWMKYEWTLTMCFFWEKLWWEKFRDGSVTSAFWPRLVGPAMSNATVTALRPKHNPWSRKISCHVKSLRNGRKSLKWWKW